ncbi:MAG: UDP-2,3-diacylglucosamine diphosphatase LpxI [Hyphomonadaceae bacterium]|nr:UDP-2,3-diacylglucosamine diphosphatase LpxI [Hyphomonadaceae bacterium]MBP9234424.1 UDP-2,3-diacylglucosamine diphosphatase LpxI [Hyphomonadaceae bacterium]
MAGRLAIVAGGGDLPRRVAEQARKTGRNPFVVGLKGFAEAGLLEEYNGPELSVGEMGRLIQLMKKEGCEEMVFAGWLKRPDFSSLKLDLKGVQSLPKILAAAKKGDDALLRAVMDVFAEAGFRIIGADDVLNDLLVSAGPLGAIIPDAEHWPDIRRAAEVARISGSLEIGQGAVSCAGLVLAVEAQEGTDRMLARVGELQVEIRGTPEARRGVLVKRPKPQQERRIDLPTIGVATVQAAGKAGLAGIAVEAGAALVVDREEVARAADQLGVFIYGFTLAEVA